MIRIRQQILVFLMFTICPILAKADPCESIINDINADITKYSDTIKYQHLPWMKLSWLQQVLGSANVKNPPNGNIQYEWRCLSDASFLIAEADTNGNLLSVNGQYNSDDGSGVFNADLTKTQSEKDFDSLISQFDTAPQPAVEQQQQSVLKQPAVQLESQEEAKCKSIISQIRSDTFIYANSIQNQRLPWKNLTWLQQKLGQPHISTAYDNIYKWPQYSMFIGADGTKAEFGTLPNGIHPQTYTDASAILGPPKKNVYEKMTINTWNCADNNSSSLTLLTGNKSLPISIMGNDCSGDRCNAFSISLAGSELKQKFAKEARLQAQIAAASLTAKLQSYNNTYKTKFKTQEELETDIVVKIKNFYSSVRECREGVYEYAMPVLQDYLFKTSTVKQHRNGNCIVNTTYQIPQIGKIDLKCNYQPANLPLFTDVEAVTAINNPIPFDKENPSELQKINEKECKRYVDGVL